METPNIIPYNAEGTIAAYTMVKPGASGGVVAAAAATDKIMGVTTDVGCVANENADVIVGECAFVKAGGTVALGDLVTSDASGNAITAAPSAGTNNRVLGMAIEAAVSGDVFRVQVTLGSFQG